MKRIILAALAVFAIAALPASASKPLLSVSVSPNPVLVGGQIDVQGCGFPTMTDIVIVTPAYRGTVQMSSDGNGCFQLRWFADSGPGDYVFRPAERHRHGGSIRLEILGEGSTTAVSA